MRYYDAEGVLKADVVDPSSGYRFYSVDAVEKYKQILFYKDIGFSLDEIKKIQLSNGEELKAILKNKKTTLSGSIEKFKKHIKTIDEICAGKIEKPFLSEILLLPFENDAAVIGKWTLCGKLVDENVIRNWRCPDCGYVWRM